MTAVTRKQAATPTAIDDDAAIDFGALPPEVDALLQRGVAAYRSNRAKADHLFRVALAVDPSVLATYFCLYKVHTYQGDLDDALAAAETGFCEAARQIGRDEDWRLWTSSAAPLEGAARFALYTLKAMAFIRLRRKEPTEAAAILDKLSKLDPADSVGWRVVAAIADGAAR